MKNVAFIFVLLAIMVEFGFTSEEPSRKREREENEEIEETEILDDSAPENKKYLYLVGATIIGQDIKFSEDDNKILRAKKPELIVKVENLLETFKTELNKINQEDQISETTKYLDLINELWIKGIREENPPKLVKNENGRFTLHELVRTGFLPDTEGYFLTFLKDLVNKKVAKDVEEAKKSKKPKNTVAGLYYSLKAYMNKNIGAKGHNHRLQSGVINEA